MSVYRIWYGDSNDRSELGRATAKDIDAVIEYVKTQYLKPDTEFYDIDYQGEAHAYLMIDLCKDCREKQALDEIAENLELDLNADPCDYCEMSEYIEIIQDTDAEPEYKTIFGTNEYADLTTDTRPQPYNTQLKEAWEQSPEKGVAALTLHTIEQNPRLAKGFSPELIEKYKQTLRE